VEDHPCAGYTQRPLPAPYRSVKTTLERAQEFHEGKTRSREIRK
jgi:hypothetical protein